MTPALFLLVIYLRDFSDQAIYLLLSIKGIESPYYIVI